MKKQKIELESEIETKKSPVEKGKMTIQFQKLPREKATPSKIISNEKIEDGESEGLDLSSFPSDSNIKIPKKKKLFGFLRKKEKIEKPIVKEMTELELLEVEIEQKKILLKQKQEEELRKKLEEEKRKKEIEIHREKVKSKSVEAEQVRDEMKSPILDEVALIPDDELIKFCSLCGKKFKKGRIIVNGNKYNQEMVCKNKKCQNIKLLELKI